MVSGELMTLRDAARELSCSLGNVYALKNAGLLQVICTGAGGKGFRVTAAEVARFKREREALPTMTRPQ